MVKENVGDMLSIIEGDITDLELIKKYNIDTIVNAAKPNLMGSDEINSVDYCIHKKINELLKLDGKLFKDKIKEELKETINSPDNKIRCKRGMAVMTGGYGLCKNVIHVVGTKADTNDFNSNNYSFTCVRKLLQCYYEIVEVIKENRNIKNIAIPIISSGIYGFEYSYAFEIAVASIGNALIKWKTRDREFFEDSGLENVYFVIKTSDKNNKDKSVESFEKFKKVFQKDKEVAFQTTYKTNKQILNDLKRNDDARGY